MNINITLRHGPLDIEVEADSEEEYRQEILNIAKFLDENEKELEVLNGLSRPSGEDSNGNSRTEQTPLEGWAQGEETSSEKEPTIAETETSGKFSSISRRLSVDEAALERVFDLPDDEDEVPALIIEELEGGVEALGDSRLERQARASLMLLYIWENIRGVEKVYSSDLGDALHMSGVDPEKMANMYRAFDEDADAYFERHGSGGPYSGVSLTRRGERAAIDEIQDIIGEL